MITPHPAADRALAAFARPIDRTLTVTHPLIVGRVTPEDVLEAHVEQLAAVVVGLAECRGRPIAIARAQVHAMLDEAIATMAELDRDPS